ncbi:acyl-homoserine-lactone synthase [Phaeobacter inhibens]|uniref:acyl-homoserine-lactone synthase n=2 Tax=Phaeobacter TaxID=302485 RepID=UPI003B968939
MELRKKVFGDGRGWRVWLTCKSDLDQYDQLDTHYVVAFESSTGRAVAGARLLRTDRSVSCGSSTLSYMVRDASHGKLPGLPCDLCYDAAPCDSSIWELTRFVSDGSPGAGALVLAAVRSFLIECNAQKFIFLSAPAVSRFARPAGFENVKPLGPLRGERGERYRVFSADVPSRSMKGRT